MFLSELKIWNFRKFGEGDNNNPGLNLSFNSGLNLLVGENDSGKTAIIDAIKIVLFTQSYEYHRLEDEDFFIPDNAAEEARKKDLKIECIFRGFTAKEAKNFLEWLGFEPHYYLKVFLEARRENGRIYGDVRAGPDEQGTALDAKARDLLRTVYLRPLRDAEGELNPRRKSRLSQILSSHKDFSKEEDHPLKKAVNAANEQIQKFFEETDETDDKKEGTEVVCQINNQLSHFSSVKNPLRSRISIEGKNLRAILEQLSLSLSNNKVGLGSNNLLFIAAEFLLLKREDYAGLKLTLIEEIEAHLHPQAQLRLIEYLQNESVNDSGGVQLILTSHSPNLASKVNLQNLIICKDGYVFNMGYEYTKLYKGDYLFLERFLDVTKANLFFADGVILVEGDAENLLIPAIAEIIDKPLTKHGASIVNVGSTAFLRYSRIFQRKNPHEFMNIPVAVITDSDEKPDEYYSNEGKDVTEEYSKRIQKSIQTKNEIYDGKPVKTFVSPDWTLEYVIALSGFRKKFYKAVLQAEKIQNSDEIGLTQDKKEKISEQVKTDFDKWKEQNLSNEKIAFEIYNNIILKKQISKTIIAQCFAKILNESTRREEIKEKLLKRDSKLNYIINSIKYATSGHIKKSEVSDD